jgi:hypothetical protein
MRKAALVGKTVLDKYSPIDRVVFGCSIEMRAVGQNAVDIVCHFPLLKSVDEERAILFVVLSVSFRFSILSRERGTLLRAP